MKWRMKHEDGMFIFDNGAKRIDHVYCIKHVVLFFMDILWNAVLLWQPRHRKKKYELSLCGIFRNEAPFLKEWIEHHLLLGVEHFYLYNNYSTDNYQDVLQAYIEQGIVTLTEWPHMPAQKPAYRHFLNNYKEQTHWVSFLDIDEFLCPLNTDSIPQWLQRFRRYPVVMTYWRFFCSSGRMTHDYHLSVREQYTHCCYKLLDVGKIFYNTDFPSPAEQTMNCIHSETIRVHGVGIPPVNQFGYFVNYGIHRWGGKAADFQCNHYWSKAYKEFEKKVMRPDAITGKQRLDMMDLYHSYEAMNTIEDHAILRFIKR